MGFGVILSDVGVILFICDYLSELGLKEELLEV